MRFFDALLNYIMYFALHGTKLWIHKAHQYPSKHDIDHALSGLCSVLESLLLKIGLIHQIIHNLSNRSSPLPIKGDTLVLPDA